MFKASTKYYYHLGFSPAALRCWKHSRSKFPLIFYTWVASGICWLISYQTTLVLLHSNHKLCDPKWNGVSTRPLHLYIWNNILLTANIQESNKNCNMLYAVFISNLLSTSFLFKRSIPVLIWVWMDPLEACSLSHTFVNETIKTRKGGWWVICYSWAEIEQAR